jgi:predicted helicase
VIAPATTPINVIIGNPPYNTQQTNEHDNNKNRIYPVINGRIKRNLRQRWNGWTQKQTL